MCLVNIKRIILQAEIEVKRKDARVVEEARLESV